MNIKGNHLRVTNKLTFLKSKLNLYRANTYINKVEITDIFKTLKKSLFIFYLPPTIRYIFQNSYYCLFYNCK